MVTTLKDTAPTEGVRYNAFSGVSQSLGNFIPFVVLHVVFDLWVFQHYRILEEISVFLLNLYFNEPTDGASFMSFGRSFQARTVEGKKELENKLVCTL